MEALKTRSFEEVKNVIEEDGRDKSDLYVKGSKLEYIGEDTVVDHHTGRKLLFGIQDTNLLKRIGINSKMFLQMSEDLRKETFEYFNNLTLKTSPNKEWLFRLNGDYIRTVLPSKADILDDIQVINIMEQHCPEEFRLLNYRTDQQTSVFQFVLSDTIEVGVDQVVPGIQIYNSELGFTKLTAESFMFRVVCANGLVTTDGRGSFFTPKNISREGWQDDFKKFLEGFKESVSNSKAQLDKSLTKIFEGDVKEFLRVHFKKFDVPTKYLKPVMEAYDMPEEQRYLGTYYGILNAITRGAQEVDQVSIRRNLEVAAGNLLI